MKEKQRKTLKIGPKANSGTTQKQLDSNLNRKGNATARFLKVGNIGRAKCLNSGCLKKFERQALLLQVYGWRR